MPPLTLETLSEAGSDRHILADFVLPLYKKLPIGSFKEASKQFVFTVKLRLNMS
jgi:hypothetical protein